MNLSGTTPDEEPVLHRNRNGHCLGKVQFPCRSISAFRTEILIGWTKLQGFSVKVVLVKVNALAARAICHSLVEISALLADPNRWNSEGKAILAITDVPVFFSLFRHVSSPQVLEQLTPPETRCTLDASAEEFWRPTVCVSWGKGFVVLPASGKPITASPAK
jgi:hypothetical protein